MKGLLTVLSFIMANLSFGQNCNCDSIFLQTQKTVEENYAGWFDKVTTSNKTAYNEWTDTQYSLSKKITSDSICAKQLQEWISFFKDKHLRIRYNRPKVVQGNQAETKAIHILANKLTETQIMTYLSKGKRLDPIEGVYENASYKLGITKVKPGLFYATIITTTNENWKPGEIKLVIKRIGDKYEGTFYEGDKSGISTHEVQVKNNILDFDIVFYEKIYPAAKVKDDITEYEMSKDKYAPGLTFKDDVAVWKFPSFENNSYEQTAYLLKKYKEKLETTAYWVLDLRNNSGGDYSIGLQLLEYIYASPVILYNAEMRMTKSNFDVWYKSYISNYYESLDSLGKNKLDERLNKIKANYNKMYNEDGKPADTLTMDKVKPFPKKIALLINEKTVSSGELFTMVARQSNKVVVVGTNSGGMMDYGNIVNYKTACQAIRIQLPTNRQLWLDTGFSVDREGLKPDVFFRGENWIEQAIQIIKQ